MKEQTSSQNSLKELKGLLEQKNRELEIEAALERVRAASLAMQKSNELRNVIAVVFQQLKSLDFNTPFCGLILYSEDHSAEHWVAGFSKEIYPESYKIPFVDHPYFTNMLNDWKKQLKYNIYVFEGSLKKEYDDWIFEHSEFKNLPKETKRAIKAVNKVILCNAFMKFGMIEVNQEEPLSDVNAKILQRFAKVFEQAYTRFLDIKNAEEQAREAQIEAALEKVRSRSLAMHKSDEVQEVVNILFENLRDLNIETDVTSVIILKENMYEMDYWVANSDNIFSTMFRIMHNDDIRILKDVMIARKSGVDFSKTYSFEEKNELWEYLFTQSDLKSIPDKRKKFVLATKAYTTSVSFTKNAAIQLNRYFNKPFTAKENEILKRFALVFEQAYVRFLDLQKAEAQAREVIRQASIDRVRGEIASMRTKNDLNRITPLIWQELIALGVPFIRCGVFIMDESREIIETYLSKPDGQSLSAFEMSFHEGGIASGAVKSWKKNKIFHEHWNKGQFVKFMQNLISEGKVDNPESFQGASAPPEALYLNFVPFKQGMLYVGNTSPLKIDELQMVKSLAEAFSIAYARYEDFNQLEKAKNKIEQTLSELKATQNQLIQSEKMASLGELTAGIAHEIQNPLNFVNNFSEVSIDLLEEMEEELVSGNTEEVIEITNDVKQNLGKINQHGKRASSIVKGMLQHSRSSTGQKELSDINILADEYLRLSYHGFRAKEKSFNAEYKLETDKSIPKINIVPQDIGRVLLNLLNNAFYACAERSRSTGTEPGRSTVNEKVKQGMNDYKPTVIVTTRFLNNNIEIIVSDNGNGIPDSMKEKIFQPFFTSKPTGSGTGLGLSLSYDIIKAHGGTIEVESAINESQIDGQSGTEFKVTLPLKQ